MSAKPRRSAAKVLELPQSPLAWPIPVAGAIAGLWSAVMSLIAISFTMSFGWILTSDSHTSFFAALQAGVGIWLLMHAVPLNLGDMVFGIPPLVLTFFALWMMRRAMKWAIRSTIVVNAAGVLLLIASMAVTYAFIAVGFSVLFASGAQVNSARLLLAAIGWVVLAGLWAIASSRGETGPAEKRTFSTPGERTSHRIKAQAPHDIVVNMWNGLAKPVRRGIVAGARVSALLLVAGFIMVVVMIVVNFSELTAVMSMLTTQTLPQFAVLLLLILFLPTVSIWFSALLIGPGFVVGGGSAVTLITQVVGPLPAVPFLTLIPTHLPWLARLLLALPVVAAFLLGDAKLKASEQLSFVVAASLTSAIINTWLSTLASGALGSGRFQIVGVSMAQTFLWSLLWTAVGMIARASLNQRKISTKVAD